MSFDSWHDKFSTHKSNNGTKYNCRRKTKMCFLRRTVFKKPARTTLSYFTCGKHIPLSEAWSCWSSALFSVPPAVFISMPIARHVCQQSEKAP